MDYMKTVDCCIHYECSVWTFIQWPPLYPEILRIRSKTVDSQSINCSWWCFWFVFINPVIAIMKSLFQRIKNQLNNKLSYCNRIKSLVMHYDKNTVGNGFSSVKDEPNKTHVIHLQQMYESSDEYSWILVLHIVEYVCPFFLYSLIRYSLLGTFPWWNYTSLIKYLYASPPPPRK